MPMTGNAAADDVVRKFGLIVVDVLDDNDDAIYPKELDRLNTDVQTDRTDRFRFRSGGGADRRTRYLAVDARRRPDDPRAIIDDKPR